MFLAKVWAKPRRDQNPKWAPAAILDLLKSAIFRRFYSNNTIEVSLMCIICIIYAKIYIIFENDLLFSRVKSKHCHFESKI